MNSSDTWNVFTDIKLIKMNFPISYTTKQLYASAVSMNDDCRHPSVQTLVFANVYFQDTSGTDTSKRFDGESKTFQNVFVIKDKSLNYSDGFSNLYSYIFLLSIGY